MKKNPQQLETANTFLLLQFSYAFRNLSTVSRILLLSYANSNSIPKCKSTKLYDLQYVWNKQLKNDRFISWQFMFAWYLQVIFAYVVLRIIILNKQFLLIINCLLRKTVLIAY